ncbi:MAG: biotin--[acetyl-CoA-carboxylase] ligase [Gemmatimonadaceae bacterium]|nr:biotin--[acetyl-CoA-carboxylase] ligase [Gemmatimonadaceae bacterium]
MRVTSTMDVAHAVAADGAPAGTLILASSQEQGRGRTGKSWQSAPDAGLWCTLIERPADPRALDVLALRVGLSLAAALDAFVEQRITLKWPNDLWLGDGKLGGILIEARWRDGLPEWVAIGVGINRKPAADARVRSSHVRADVSRDALLGAVAPALRRAAAATGVLSDNECREWATRDRIAGRRVLTPADGVVQGITADGAISIRGDDGMVRHLHSGSLTVFEGPESLSI